MSKAAELSEALERRLDGIKKAAGYSTDIAGVYGFGKNKSDKAPLPCLLVRVTEDAKEEQSGDKWLRAITYQVDGLFSRTASLQDLQRLQHDIIRAVGAVQLPMVRPLSSGWLMEESTEFDPDSDGSAYRKLTVSITLRYVESY